MNEFSAPYPLPLGVVIFGAIGCVMLGIWIKTVFLSERF